MKVDTTETRKQMCFDNFVQARIIWVEGNTIWDTLPVFKDKHTKT